MPLTLKDIEDYDRKDMLRVEHIHWAIINEVRDLRNWENALTLLTSYLAPVIIASEKAVAASTAAASTAATGNGNTDTDKAATAATQNNNSPASSSPTTTTDTAVAVAAAGGAQPKTSTSKFSDFVEDETTGQFTKQLTEQDIRLIQWSIAALVRYAPTPSESNVVYMFYLQRQPPVRNDETIDNCLISLIYQYAQVKDDPELQAKGLDLIKVALERGVGLPSYKSRTSVKNQDYRQQKDTILASVSKPILFQQGLQITQDGKALEPRRQGGQYQQQGRPFTPQKQQLQVSQQGSQPSYKGSSVFPAGGQRQGQAQGQHQAQAQAQTQGQVASGRKPGRLVGSSSPQPQSQQPQQQQVPQQTQTQTQTQGKSKPRHRKQDSPRLANKDTQDTPTTNINTAYTRQEELDQYDYYTKASRSFSGTERVKPGSRPAFGGVGGGKLRTIAFVPASNNPMLTTDHPAPSSSSTEEGQAQGGDGAAKDDVTTALTEGVEKLRLDHASE
ncbi:hypothetical protein BGW39_004584 [Mortierella sp. 14UC]|nr:hypothetical protein BGW39_004584 [Mortierella sp. 14UC]